MANIHATLVNVERHNPMLGSCIYIEANGKTRMIRLNTNYDDVLVDDANELIGEKVIVSVDEEYYGDGLPIMVDDIVLDVA